MEGHGFTVQRNPSGGIITHARAKVKIHFVEDNHLTLVFSAPFIFFGKNLRLAKSVEDILLSVGAVKGSSQES